jgi:hypothetical protein
VVDLHLATELPDFCGTLKFITIFTWACHWSVPVLSHMSPVHILLLYLFKIHFNILPSVPRSSKQSLSFTFTHKNPIWISFLSHVFRMPCPIHVVCDIHMCIDLRIVFYVVIFLWGGVHVVLVCVHDFFNLWTCFNSIYAGDCSTACDTVNVFC